MGTPEQPSLAELIRSPGYTENIMELSLGFYSAKDKADAVALLRQVSDALGVDSAFFTTCFGDDQTHRSYRSIVACDPLWESQYASNHWYLNDPWLEYAMRHFDPARTDEMDVQSEERRWVVEAAAHFGFVGAMVAPVPAPPMRARAGALVLGSRQHDFFSGEGYRLFQALARTVAWELGGWQVRAVRDELIKRARINDADLELLRHEQQGHSTKVIAALLRSEVNTIDSRFHRLSLRLGATNRKTALRIAELHDLL